MQYVSPPLKKKLHQQIPPPQKKNYDNFYEVPTTKCTKTRYQTATIRPIMKLVTNALKAGDKLKRW